MFIDRKHECDPETKGGSVGRHGAVSMVESSDDPWRSALAQLGEERFAHVHKFGVCNMWCYGGRWGCGKA